MSFIISKDIPCQHCQFPNEVEVWSIINVKEDPELKDILLGGELNMMECTACKKIFYAEHFVLYHDPEAHLMAFVYPLSDRANRIEFENKTITDFNLYQQSAVTGPLPYTPVTLFGLDELVELVSWEEDAQIQSEVVTHIAQKEGLAIKKLKPSFYRRHRLPPVVPAVPSLSNEREALLKGIQKIRSINDRLSLYASAEKVLTEQPALSLEFVPPVS